MFVKKLKKGEDISFHPLLYPKWHSMEAGRYFPSRLLDLMGRLSYSHVDDFMSAHLCVGAQHGWQSPAGSLCIYVGDSSGLSA